MHPINQHHIKHLLAPNITFESLHGAFLITQRMFIVGDVSIELFNIHLFYQILIKDYQRSSVVVKQQVLIFSRFIQYFLESFQLQKTNELRNDQTVIPDGSSQNVTIVTMLLGRQKVTLLVHQEMTRMAW